MSDSQQIQRVVPQIDIPANVLEDIVKWITSEIQNAKGSRTELENNMTEWERLYEARPKVDQKNFPWKNASNIVVPVIGTAVDTTFSRIMESVFGAPDLWAVTPRTETWADIDEPLTTWMNWIATQVLKLVDVCPRWFLAALKHGTGIAKLEWVQRIRNVMYADASGGQVKQQITSHNGPELRPIPICDFLFSNDAVHTQDFQNCSWIAERQLYTWKSLKEAETSGLFIGVDQLLGKERSTVTALESQVQQNTGIDIPQPGDFEIYEVWASYDVDGDGVPEEIVLNLHVDTGTVLRGVYNFYRHQERPFHRIRLMLRDMSPLGLGLCQMLAPIQEEVSTIHNQRIDNATLANTKVFKALGTATHRISPKDFYPGAVINVDNMEDLQEITMGEGHVTLLQEELHSMSIGERRSGVSDYSVGRESQAIGSNATATSTLALIQEGNKRFKLTISDIRKALSDIGHQCIMLYQQFAPESKVMYEMFSPKDQGLVRQFLTLPAEYTRDGIILDTPTVSEAVNRDVDKQLYLSLLNVVKDYYGGIAQAAMLAAQVPDPTIKSITISGIMTATKIWKKTLNAFGIADAEMYSPDLAALAGGQDVTGTQGSPIGVPGQSPMGMVPGAGTGAAGNVNSPINGGDQGLGGGTPIPPGGNPGAPSGIGTP